MSSDEKKPLSRIKSGALSRGFALARMSASAGAKAAGHVVGNLFSSAESRPDRLKALLLSQVEILARELGQLKGSVMKVGQMLSVYGEHFLPEEVNSVLKTLQSQSPPLAWEAIKPVLEEQLAPELLESIEIDHTALASASLGQVHLARVKAGSPLAAKVPDWASDAKLAMKIQYPGVDKAIDSDLNALKRILSVSKILPQSEKYEELFKEVRHMLHQEVDYGNELEATKEFRELLANDPRYIVPRVVPELSTKRILVTEFLAGSPLDSPEVKALPQARRDALGLAALELLFIELYVLHQVQTDPHFGNYRVRIGENGEPDRLILLDFGAVRKLSKTFLKPYFALHRGTFNRDAPTIEKAALDLGFLTDEDSQEMRESFEKVTYLISEPFSTRDIAYPAPAELMSADGTYDWGKSDLPDRMVKIAAKFAYSFKLRPPPREIVFLDRKFGGTYFMLSALGARIAGREILKSYMDKAFVD